jgi:hypothetical protein
VIQWETTDAVPGELLARRVSRRRSVRQPRRTSTDPYAIATGIALRVLSMALLGVALAQVSNTLSQARPIDPAADLPWWGALAVISLPAALGAIVAWRAADNCEFPPAVGEEVRRG